MSGKNDIEKNIWNIFLNTSVIEQQKNTRTFGKNIWFKGNEKFVYVENDITIIGYGRIYNEYDLWNLILPNTNAKITKKHSLSIVVGLYNKFGIEKTLEYLEGDFSFVLFDMNLYGEESLLYIVRDSLGLCPLYQLVPNTNNKKVQFYDENVDIINKYIFSSSIIENTDDLIYEPIINGSYILFTHSFKVSANWKFKNNIRYYTLPFYSTYIEPLCNKFIEIEIALNKRIQYISSKNNNEIGVILFEKQKQNELSLHLIEILKKNETIINYKIISFLDKTSNELEEIYPTIIQQLKQKINNNDPSIIRAYLIPVIIAKYIKENEPQMKYVFMIEPFIYKWMFINVFDRREEFYNSFFQERIKGWIDAFLEYDIELIIPYLDRTLLQKI